MNDIKKHQREAGHKPKPRPKPKSAFTLGRLKRAGKLNNVTDDHIERGVAVGQVFDNPQAMRKFVREAFDRQFKRRPSDQW